MLKAVVKNSPSDEIRNRIVPSDAVTAMTERLAKLKDEIQDVLKEEKEEKMVSSMYDIDLHQASTSGHGNQKGPKYGRA